MIFMDSIFNQLLEKIDSFDLDIINLALQNALDRLE